MAVNKDQRTDHVFRPHALQAICPFFAMFPSDFVRKYVEKYSKRGDWVFDPFCGRGTTIFESLTMGRNAAGSDINPVAYCVSGAKAERPTLENVKIYLDDLQKRYKKIKPDQWKRARSVLPPFFKRAFYSTTLNELLFLRSALDWRNDRTERFIAALILGSLHGEMDRSNAYFSNQMPRTICLKPDYSLRYWNKKGLFPKKREVFQMLKEKAEYRLKDLPQYPAGKVKLTDVRHVSQCFQKLRRKVALVITSPPYLNVTRYEEDQWLRLWFLGGEPRPTYGKVSKDDRYEGARKYWQFLKEAWVGLAPLMKFSAKIVVRLGAIGLDECESTQQLKASIKNAFPSAHLLQHPERSELVGRQALNFLPTSKGCLFELDYVFAV